jgi:uncharacterized iron-regulated protein
MTRLLRCTAVAGTLLLGACAAQRPTMNIESPYRDLNTVERGQIVHLATGQLLTEEELYAHLAHYRVVYVGESHDSVDDHAVQLSVLTAMNQRFPGRVALGMEMLRRPSQGDVDRYLAGELTEKEFLRVWQKNWGPRSFPYYRGILSYCREQGIPVLALNAGRDLEEAVRAGPTAELAPEFAARLPEMDLDDPYYRATMEGFFGGHEGGSNRVEIFNRIQVLRDETMADTAAKFLRSPEGADKRLVVFAGGNHVRYGYGIPRRLFRRVPAPYVVVDPLTEDFPEDKKDKLMNVELPALPMRPADIYWAVGYKDLEGQQVMLGVQIEDAEEGGVRVKGVMPGSPAAGAGLQEGDVIVGVDGEEVREMFDLTYQVSLHKPNDVGPVEVQRGGERFTVDVTYDVPRHGTDPKPKK